MTVPISPRLTSDAVVDAYRSLPEPYRHEYSFTLQLRCPEYGRRERARDSEGGIGHGADVARERLDSGVKPGWWDPRDVWIARLKSR